MANISEYLWTIANKIYGRDIRMAIHDALDKINSVLNSHTSNTDIHTTSTKKAEWDNKQDKLIAGDNIIITDDVISGTPDTVPDSVVYNGQELIIGLTMLNKDANGYKIDEHGEYVLSYANGQFYPKRLVDPNKYANAMIGKASGEIITVSDVQKNTEARSLKILGETTEIGEGEKSPDNPYELEGVENAVARVHGKNLIDKNSIIIGEGYSFSTGAITGNSGAYRTPYIPVRELTDYYLSGITDYENSFVAYYTEDKELIGKTSANKRTERHLTTPANCKYIGFTQYKTTTEATGQELYDMCKDTLQLELGSTATEYEPFQGYDEYPITLPQPLYSLPDGTRDYIEVNHKDKTATLKQNVGVVELDGTEDWSNFIDQNETHWRTTHVPTPRKISNVMYNSTHFVASNPTIPTTFIYIGAGTSSITMHLLKTDFPDLESWRSWLSTQNSNGTPVKILYKIDETESNLPYFDIPLYSPTSIISTDKGSLEVQYNRDINTALTEFVPRVNTANRVYTTSATGQQETKPISEFATAADVANKVDKVEGKGLSTEDYTTEEKEKLARIEENANNFIVNNAVGIKDKIVTGIILIMKDENGFYARDDGLGNHMLCWSSMGYFAFPLDATITIGGIE